jgi:hypothetical protein
MLIENEMKKVEDWILDRFVPWFMSVSKYIGVLAIVFGIAYLLHI